MIDGLEIEKYPCVDGNESRLRERYWFEQLQASLNTYRPIISKEEAETIKKDVEAAGGTVTLK